MGGGGGCGMWHLWETEKERTWLLVEGSKNSKSLAKPRRRLEDNIKMNLQEVE